MLEERNRVGTRELAVETLDEAETNLAILRVKFIEALHYHAETVNDAVVRDITEDDRLSVYRGRRCKVAVCNWAAMECVGLV